MLNRKFFMTLLVVILLGLTSVMSGIGQKTFEKNQEIIIVEKPPNN